jgi:hypothetical protein
MKARVMLGLARAELDDVDGTRAEVKAVAIDRVGFDQALGRLWA